MSSQPNDFAEADLNTALHASLLVTSKKYGRLWRRTLYIRIFISLTRTARTPTATRESEQLPHYTPLPTRTSSSCAIEVVSDNEEEDTVRSEQRIKNDIARVVKEKDLESLRELGGVDRVRSVLCHRASEVFWSYRSQCTVMHHETVKGGICGLKPILEGDHNVQVACNLKSEAAIEVEGMSNYLMSF